MKHQRRREVLLGSCLTARRPPLPLLLPAVRHPARLQVLTSCGTSTSLRLALQQPPERISGLVSVQKRPASCFS